MNDMKLAWDILKIPHHCSYKAMADEKGGYITTPTNEFQWLLKQGTIRGIIVSTSNIIPSITTTQPPHIETYRRYQETASKLDAELIVTMEHPSKQKPDRLVININEYGPMIKKSIVSPTIITTTQRAPRVG
jgi:hypothetical protein